MFKSTHNLPFEQGGSFMGEGSPLLWKIGTCHGLWYPDDEKLQYVLLAVTNDEQGNGHFTDVLEWFENSCKRDQRDFVVAEVWNKRLRKHLIEKRGFKPIEHSDSVIKKFRV